MSRIVLILIMAISLLIPANAAVVEAQTSPVLPPPGMVSWWTGDNTADDFVDGNHGMLQNGATYGVGKVGPAFSFDGVNDYVLVPYSASLNAGAKFSVDLWFKAYSTQGSYFTLVDKSHRSSEAAPYYSGWCVQGDPYGRVGFYIGNGNTITGITTPSSMKDGSWHHFAGTLDGATLCVYLDGNSLGTVPFSGTPAHNSDPLAIGRWQFSPSRYFNGAIDEVEIFSRALSASEIQAIYNAGSAGKWKDKTSPTTTVSLNPSTPNGNNGWYISNVTVTLTAVDNEGGSGVAKTEYSLDGISWTTYTNPVTISSEGTTTIYYRSVDNAGNVELLARNVLYTQLDMSALFNSDAYTGGQNYLFATNDWYSKYPIYPGTSYPDAQYGAVPMDMKPAGTRNVWLSSGYDRTAPFPTSITMNTNVASATNIWVAGLDGGWAFGGSPVEVSYVLDGQRYTSTYNPNDWAWGGTGPGLNLWVWVRSSPGDIAVARIDLPKPGTLSQVAIVDAQGIGGASIPVFAVTIRSVDDRFKSITLKIDRTSPTLVFGTPTPAPNAAGWNSSDVSVAFAASDNLSGVDSTSLSSSPIVLTGEGSTVTGTVVVTDKAGNSANFTTTVFKIDRTPPTITGARTPPPNANDWNNTNVTVSFTANDSLSGIASVTSPNVVSTEGQSQTVIGTAIDVAGNSAATTVGNINIDKTPPTLTFGPVTPAPNAAGWNNSNVTIPYAVNDNLSGVVSTSLPSPLSFTAEGSGLTQSVTVVDRAGNSVTFVSPVVNLDKTRPVITVSSPQPRNYFTSENFTVVFFASDNISGLASVGATLDGNPVTSGHIINLAGMAGSHSFTVSATDAAGNTDNATVSFYVIIVATVDIDPDTLNVKSQSDKNAITVYVEFPAGYDVAQINVASVKLSVNGVTVAAQLTPSSVGDYDGDKIADRMVKFDREAVIAALSCKTGEITMMVSGELNDGRKFSGGDTIKVINPGK